MIMHHSSLPLLERTYASVFSSLGFCGSTLTLHSDRSAPCPSPSCINPSSAAPLMHLQVMIGMFPFLGAAGAVVARVSSVMSAQTGKAMADASGLAQQVRVCEFHVCFGSRLCPAGAHVLNMCVMGATALCTHSRECMLPCSSTIKQQQPHVCALPSSSSNPVRVLCRGAAPSPSLPTRVPMLSH